MPKICKLTDIQIVWNNESAMDLLPDEQIFDLDKSRQKCCHDLKEHHKISNIPKFRCEML
jgi:hypothetical protein